MPEDCTDLTSFLLYDFLGQGRTVWQQAGDIVAGIGAKESCLELQAPTGESRLGMSQGSEISRPPLYDILPPASPYPWTYQNTVSNYRPKIQTPEPLRSILILDSFPAVSPVPSSRLLVPVNQNFHCAKASQHPQSRKGLHTTFILMPFSSGQVTLVCQKCFQMLFCSIFFCFVF